MEIEQVIDEWKIVKLLNRWVQTRDTMDVDHHLGLWTPDGTMHVGFFSGGCRGFMQTVIDKGADTRHFMGVPLSEVRGNRARAVTYVLLICPDRTCARPS
ncbi:nuclear transport factor 2 family protein [Streptomyces halobius]|uniref:Nuclear transport factor 2 family protein n=1 Tax=Streptomyces halobius TaxID=2879846 RepID=A0ABY4M1M7_9ACTN|nr:nuclear transport factor 2 family protein [Streptomyces halobius]UQA90779.1 nuclear transport factor 2 family protein [Streptomyces halobius]